MRDDSHPSFQGLQASTSRRRSTPKDSLESLLDALSDLFATLIAMFLFTSALILLWMCFDDWLASALGIPLLGDIPWWVMMLGLIFTRMALSFLGLRSRPTPPPSNS